MRGFGVLGFWGFKKRLRVFEVNSKSLRGQKDRRSVFFLKLNVQKRHLISSTFNGFSID